MSHKLLFVVVLAIASVSFADFANTGDIVIKPYNIQDDGMFLSIRKGAQKLESVNEVDVGNYIANSIGISLPSDTATHIPSTIFQKEDANLFVFVEGVEPELRSTLQIMKKGVSVPLKKNFYPEDTVSTLTTLFTSTTPSVHGIPAKAWRNQNGRIEAYKSQAMRNVNSVSDILFQTYEGESFILSASSNYQEASALNIHPYLFDASSNNFALFWNFEEKKFENINKLTNNLFGMNLTYSQIKQKVVKRNDDQISVKIIGSIGLNVVIPSKNLNVVFDLYSPEDLSFFGEIEFVNQFLESFENHFTEVTKDNIPDLFSFSFASLKELSRKYGVTSNEVKAALHLLDISLLKLVNKMNSLYKDNVNTEIILLGSSATEKVSLENSVKDIVYSIVRPFVASKESFSTYYPIIYLEDKSQQQRLCSTLRKRITLAVDCVTEIDNNSFFIMQQNNGTSSTTNEAAATFQIVLWMSIVLVLCVFAAIYTMAYMDTGSDTLLYRMTGKPHSS